jgi:hypothetical protein
MYAYFPGRVSDNNNYPIIHATEQYGTVNEAMVACTENPSCVGLGYKGSKSDLGKFEYDYDTKLDIELYRSRDIQPRDVQDDPTWSTWVKPTAPFTPLAENLPPLPFLS